MKGKKKHFNPKIALKRVNREEHMQEGEKVAKIKHELFCYTRQMNQKRIQKKKNNQEKARRIKHPIETSIMSGPSCTS